MLSTIAWWSRKLCCARVCGRLDKYCLFYLSFWPEKWCDNLLVLASNGSISFKDKLRGWTILMVWMFFGVYNLCLRLNMNEFTSSTSQTVHAGWMIRVFCSFNSSRISEVYLSLLITGQTGAIISLIITRPGWIAWIPSVRILWLSEQVPMHH